jgi:hypothetical protein
VPLSEAESRAQLLHQGFRFGIPFVTASQKVIHM